jgi:hypothetical protein
MGAVGWIYAFKFCFMLSHWNNGTANNVQTAFFFIVGKYHLDPAGKMTGNRFEVF